MVSIIRAIEPVGVGLVMVGHHLKDREAAKDMRGALGDAFKQGMDVFGRALRGARFGAHVQFQAVRHHDHGLRAISVL